MRLAVSLAVLSLLVLAGMTIAMRWAAELSWLEAIGITALSTVLTGLLVGAIFAALWAGGAM